VRLAGRRGVERSRAEKDGAVKPGPYADEREEDAAKDSVFETKPGFLAHGRTRLGFHRSSCVVEGSARWNNATNMAHVIGMHRSRMWPRPSWLREAPDQLLDFFRIDV
jgi:hypothetical protein